MFSDLETTLQVVVALCLGVGLSSACGFRVFLPMLGMSIGAKIGWMDVSSGFEWLGSWPAIILLSVATVAEIGAYFFPWVDNLLDTVATPAAVIAGVIVVAASLIEVGPWVKWSVAAIAGGGSAGVIKAGMAFIRGGSTVTTGGVANPGVSLAEMIVAFLMTVLAMLLPVIAAIVAALLFFVCLRFAWRAWQRLRGRDGNSRSHLSGDSAPPMQGKPAGPDAVPPRVV